MGMQEGQTQSGHNNEPNIVPMIDVLLVLLVIFMLMVPLSRRVLDVQLPNPNEIVAENQDSQIVLEVIPGGVYRINTRPIASTDLSAKVNILAYMPYYLQPTKRLLSIQGCFYGPNRLRSQNIDS